jgi:outer membrane protein OmpA-like peptidoglycan-associated protein
LNDPLDSGMLRVYAVGIGPRQPLRMDAFGATPENRRVEIKP